MNGLSWQTLTLNPLTSFGLLLILGVIGGQIATRTAKLPSITGYVLTGLIIGPMGLHIIDNRLLHEADIFTQLALGLALFETGQRVDLKWLKVEKALLLTTVGISLAIFAALSTLLYLLGFHLPESLLMATLGMSSSPIVILEVVRSTKAEGQVTERLINTTALSNLLAMTTFAIVLSYNHISQTLDVEAGILTPSWLVLGSSLLGISTGLVAIWMKQRIGGHQPQAQRVLIFGSIVLVTGLAEMLHMLPSMALLTLGLCARNIRSGHTLLDRQLIPATHFFFVVFFVSTGAQLSLQSISTYGLYAVLYLLARTLINTGLWHGLSTINGLTRKRATWLGLSLLPMPDNTAMVLGLGMLSLGAISPSFTGTMMAMYVISSLAGPILTRLALSKAGETR